MTAYKRVLSPPPSQGPHRGPHGTFPPPPFLTQVMVAEALDIERETYFAILMDRESLGPVLVGSPEGGVDIEEVAASSPEKIFKVRNPLRLGATSFGPRRTHRLFSCPMVNPRSPLTSSRALRTTSWSAWLRTLDSRATLPSRWGFRRRMRVPSCACITTSSPQSAD